MVDLSRREREYFVLQELGNAIQKDSVKDTMLQYHRQAVLPSILDHLWKTCAEFANTVKRPSTSNGEEASSRACQHADPIRQGRKLLGTSSSKASCWTCLMRSQCVCASASVVLLPRFIQNEPFLSHSFWPCARVASLCGAFLAFYEAKAAQRLKSRTRTAITELQGENSRDLPFSQCRSKHEILRRFTESPTKVEMSAEEEERIERKPRRIRRESESVGPARCTGRDLPHERFSAMEI